MHPHAIGIHAALTGLTAKPAISGAVYGDGTYFAMGEANFGAVAPGDSSTFAPCQDASAASDPDRFTIVGQRELTGAPVRPE